MKTYRVAILGCRNRGTEAALAYHAHPRTEVVALCDLVPELLDALGDTLGVTARYSDLDAMISETKPDIVAIPTGTEFHHQLCLRVLSHGVNIDVEKPICVDLEQADEVTALAASKGARIAVHHQGRVGAAMQAARRAVEQGRIGEVRYIHGSGKGYYGGYGLLNIGTHIINNFLVFGGHATSVSASLTTNGHAITPQDVVPSPNGMGTIAGEFITATMQMESGIPATLVQHRFPEMAPIGHYLEIHGTAGRILAQSHQRSWLLPQSYYLPDGDLDRWEPLPAVHVDGFDPEGPANTNEYWYVDEYVRALDEGRDHESSGAEALHTLEIMMAIFESGASGQSVKLPQARRDHPLLRWRAEHGLGPPAEMPRPYPEWLAAEDRRIGDGD
jgi:predicted dehydrogenase